MRLESGTIPFPFAGNDVRWLVLIHRYLGISIGILMAGWCLSGIVMMYVGYPQWSEADRLRGLRPLEMADCCSLPAAALADDEPVKAVQLEMLGARPVLRLTLPSGAQRSVDLPDGELIATVSPGQALGIARRYLPAEARARELRLQSTIDFDQWTVAGVPRIERPLYRFAADDAAASELYVSLRSGRVVQSTTARQRFWNWLGAVPHWLYFAQLRHNAMLWSAVVVWTSLAGCFLAATGIFIGVHRFVRRNGGRWSPFRGLLLWHHIPGLLAGVFALTWVASGLISMNPWGFLESPDAGSGARGGRARSEWLTGAQIRDCLLALHSVPLPAGTVSLDSAPMDGRLYLIASNAAGARSRLDAGGKPAPLSSSDVGSVVSELTPPGAKAALGLMRDEDAYYFAHHRDTAPLPVYRAVLDDEQSTRYYIDPVAGAVLRKVDGNSRWYRWLHEGLHRMDFTPMLRSRPLWDVVMWVLMCAVATITCTGAVLGVRRLLPRAR